jgi:hypothetical protein
VRKTEEASGAGKDDRGLEIPGRRGVAQIERALMAVRPQGPLKTWVNSRRSDYG